MGLFRKEAVDAARARLQGNVVLLPRLSHTLLCAALLAWLLAVALFLTQASYSRKETVRGWLEPSTGNVRVYPLNEGRLERLLVRDGESVAAGQALAIIHGDRVLDDGVPLGSLLLEEYQRQQAALERQLAREEIMMLADEDALQLKLESAGQELGELDKQLKLMSERVTLARQRLERRLPLAESGHITTAELEDLREQNLALETEHQALVTRRIRHIAGIREIESELARLPGDMANRMDALGLKLSDVSQQVARLRGEHAYVVQAPLAGKVNNISLQPGQKTHYDKPLMTVIPAEAELVARLLVPVHAAGFLESGQVLAFRYDAFPYQKYGLHPGRILRVAASATLASDHHQLPLPVEQPVFRVSAQPDHAAIDAHGERIELKPGMTLSADVMLERRSLLQWLLEPLLSLRGRLT